MFYQLPPVGNPIKLSSVDNPEHLLEPLFSPYKARYYASGTAALAAAISAAIRLKDVDSPEVILPAYGCPDLVSAVDFSCAKPILVDLEPERPWMDLEQLRARVNSRTVAIIATNLFGISERIIQLRSVTEQVGAVLIEDSAQGFPGGEESTIGKGDLVVLSFGRGKPVSVLGGGAVLFRESALADQLPAGQAQAHGSISRKILIHLKMRLYNRMISPRLYWLPQSLPFLHLGETRYHPLAEIDTMDLSRLAMLPANIASYQSDGMQVQQALGRMLNEVACASSSLVDLPAVCHTSQQQRLLRYPLLVDESTRDCLYQQLNRSGSGPSVMYPAAMPGISGLEKLLNGQGSFPAAEAFAARILTLPTHKRVSSEDILKIRHVLCSD